MANFFDGMRVPDARSSDLNWRRYTNYPSFSVTFTTAAFLKYLQWQYCKYFSHRYSRASWKKIFLKPCKPLIRSTNHIIVWRKSLWKQWVVAMSQVFVQGNKFRLYFFVLANLVFIRRSVSIFLDNCQKLSRILLKMMTNYLFEGRNTKCKLGMHQLENQNREKWST